MPLSRSRLLQLIAALLRERLLWTSLGDGIHNTPRLRLAKRNYLDTKLKYDRNCCLLRGRRTSSLVNADNFSVGTPQTV